MAFINPYIEKVENNPYIILDSNLMKEKKWAWKKYFGNANDIILEIGTWMGNTFSYEIEKSPHSNFIGMEIKYKRLERTTEKALNKGGKNFVLLKEYWEKIDTFLDKDEVSKTIIYFPDPWGKENKQRKNRIISEDFLIKLAHITKAWWSLLFKTDHEWYFNDALEIVKKVPVWKELVKTYDYEDTEKHLYDKTKVTEFEAMYRGENKKICFLELKKES